jgi:hypothetical protein
MASEGGDAVSRRQLGLEAAGVALLTLVLTWVIVPSVGRAGTFFRPVLFNWFGPEKHGVSDRLAEGDLPLWSYSNFGGEPLLANLQHGVLYPLNLPFWVWRTSLALEIVAVLHLVLAALGMWALCRAAYRTGPWSAAVAAVAFGLGSFTMAHLVFPNQLQVIAWVPWVVLFTHFTLERSEWRWVVLLGGALAMQMLAGHPEEFVYTLVMVALYGVAWLIGQGRAATLRTALTGAGRLVAGTGLLVLLSAPQLLPTLQLVGLGYRSDPGYRGETAILKAQALNTVLPDFGIVVRSEATASAGVAVLVLAAIGLTARSRIPGRSRARDWVRGWAAVLVASGFVLSLGSQTPAFRVLRDLVPLLGDFRFPLRWLLLPCVAVPVLAAFGVDALAEARAETWRRHLTHLAVAAAVLVGSLGVVLAIADVAAAPASQWWWLAAAAAAGGAAVAARARWVPFVVVGALLLGLTAVEVTTQRPYAEYLFVSPDSLYDDYGPILDRLGEEGGRYITMPRYEPDLTDTEDVEIPEGFDERQRSIYLRGLSTRLQGHPNAQTATGAETFLGRDGGVYPTRRLAEWNQALFGVRPVEFNNGQLTRPPSQWRTDVLDYQGVEWWVAPRLDDTETAVLEEQGFAPVDQAEWITLWQRDGAEVAHLVHDVEVIPDADERLARLAEVEDLTAQALVEEEPPFALSGPTAVEAGTGGEAVAADQVEVVEREHERVTIETDSSGPGLLVVADPAYPGWTATVDGEPAEVITADHAYQGVYLEAGEHTVTLQYDEPRFWTGLWITGLTLAALAGAAVWRMVIGPRRRRRTT